MRGEGLERSAQEGKPDRESCLESSGSTAGSFSTIQGKAGGEEKLGEVTPHTPGSSAGSCSTPGCTIPSIPCLSRATGRRKSQFLLAP